MNSVATKTTSPQLTFTADWQNQIQGSFIPGTIKLRYDLQRLATEAEPAESDIEVFARFLPEGVIWSNPLKLEKKAGAKKKNGSSYVATDLPIPADCEELELWFSRQLPSGETQWDSNFGKNYRQRFPSMDLEVSKVKITRSKAKKPVADSFMLEVKSGLKIEAVTLECSWEVDGESVPLSLPMELKSEKKTGKTWAMPDTKIAIPCGVAVTYSFSYYIQGVKYSGASCLAE